MSLRQKFSHAADHPILSLGQVTARLFNGLVGFLPARAINRVASTGNNQINAGRVWAFLRHGPR
ncbi:MAG: hypothetical protein JWO78_1625 [Micavibrio sp.]|nr:hypothetical protein [Micavibrio sp.]